MLSKDNSLNFSAKRINESDMSMFKVFVSHAGKDIKSDERYVDLQKAFSNVGIQTEIDYKFLRGGDSYTKKIPHKMCCFAGIILASDFLWNSDWCTYEIGFFSGRKMPIFVFDPENNLEKSEYTELFKPFMRGIEKFSDAKKLAERIKEIHSYSSIFCNEMSGESSKELFDEKTPNYEVITIKITSNVFKDDVNALNDAQFGILAAQYGRDNYCRTKDFVCPDPKCKFCDKSLLDVFVNIKMSEIYGRKCRLFSPVNV